MTIKESMNSTQKEEIANLICSQMNALRLEQEISNNKIISLIVFNAEETRRTLNTIKTSISDLRRSKR